ncbi:hypothetical protein IEI94_07500 [Halomonas sp. ML-15]|nr:hypothetical protein [Halomonas sp. ML-15]MBD3895696.1 hypothetical protein [Halomonas sp. ML-15]
MMGMTAENCMMMDAMGWMMPIVGIALLALLGLSIASLIRYLFGGQ